MINKVYFIKNLDCANCASKLENELNKIENIKATIDFMAQKLYISYKNENDINNKFSQILTIIKNVESDVVITSNECDISNCHSCSCHNNKSSVNEKTILIIRLVLTFSFIVFAFILELNSVFTFILFLTAYLIIGYDVLLSAIKNILKGKVFDENFLMSIATIGAFAISDYTEAIAVMIFYQIGEYFQNYAVNKSRKSISALMDIKPDYANLKSGNEIIKVSPNQVNIGDIILVKNGEKVPLDGIILKGNSFIDSVALTGESIPKQISVNDEVLSGVINTGEVLEIKVTKPYEQSTVYKILQLVESASSKKAKVEQFITRFSKYYTPIVVISAILLAFIPPLLINTISFKQCFTNALTFLVISCPCALVISVPLSFFAGIGGISKLGVLVKESRYLEILSEVGTVVFDKTGTLTKGVFEVQQIKPINIGEDEFLKYCSLAEFYSNHPIAKSIQNFYKKAVNQEEISNYKDIPGYGVSLNINDDIVLFGNSKLMTENNIDFSNCDNIASTVCHLSINYEYKGYIVISDTIKNDSQLTVKSLKNMGITSIMLTGDNKKISENVANIIGIDKVYFELLPTDKAQILEDIIKNTNKKVAFVGDGINDAPVLTIADVGISMGGVGSDSAIEASDIVLMTDEPIKIIKAIKHSRYTLGIVKQNIIFALSIKILFLILGAFGIIPMLGAVFADVGVSIIAILNSIRALKTKDNM